MHNQHRDLRQEEKDIEDTIALIDSWAGLFHSK